MNEMNLYKKALRKAIKILETNGWLQEGLAYSTTRKSWISPLHSKADRFCAVGALEKADPLLSSEICREAFVVLGMPLAQWNDRLPKKTGKRSVLRLFRRLLKKA